MEGRSSIRWSGARLNHDEVGAVEALCWSVLFRMGLKGIEGMQHLKRIVPTGSGPPLKQWIRRKV